MRTRRSDRGGPGLRRTTRIAGWGTGAAGVAVAVLVVLGPATFARSPVGPATGAPYAGMGVVLSTTWKVAGCGKASITSAPAFSPTTGVGGFGGSASAKGCGSPTPGDLGVAIAQIELTYPINTSATGRHTVTVVWSTILNGSATERAGRCTPNATAATAYCDRIASAFVFGYATLIDATNGTRLPSSAWPGNFTTSETNTSCVFGTCTTTTTGPGSGSIVGSFPWAWSWSKVFLNATHAYLLDMVLYGGAVASLTTFAATLRGASASATLNSATGGNQESITSITVK